MKKQAHTLFHAAAALAALALVAAPAAAQRDPAYQAARTAGQVGEKMDGYLGAVGSIPAEVDKIIKDLNIKRKAVYTQGAQGAGVSVEEFAFGAGCKNIRDTAPGEKYLAPDGTWKTRAAGQAPQRDTRCP